jgi:hypothetical protein
VILGIVGALVSVVRDTVAIAIAPRDSRAASLERIGRRARMLVGAAVFGVGNAVAIVVAVRAAVTVLEAVEVLRVERTTVLRVAETVAVRIGVAGRRAWLRCPTRGEHERDRDGALQHRAAA